MNAKQKMNWRRWTALLLCLLLTLSALPLQALAAETQTDVVSCYLYRPYKCRCCDYL